MTNFWLAVTLFSGVVGACAQLWTHQGAKEVKWFTTIKCRDSSGQNGTCITLQSCFADTRFPHLSGWSEFISGDYDSCAYITAQGVPFVGACCVKPKHIPVPAEMATTTTTAPPTPAAADIPVQHQEEVDEEETTTAAAVKTTTQKSRTSSPPPALDIPGSPAGWPPTHAPLPTHKPFPTPAHLFPGWPWPFSSTTRKTVTTRKPSSSTQAPWWLSEGGGGSTVAPVTETAVDVSPTDHSRSTCGTLNNSFRVVNGEMAGYWPWIAGLIGKRGLFCGGSLISNYHILTAAHCVYGNSPGDITIRLGDRDLSTTSDYTHIDVKVSTITIHPNYNTKTNHNDLAILRLASKVTFNTYIQPICLPTSNAKSFAGQHAVVIGWGATRARGPTTKVLMQLNIRVWSVSECQTKFQKNFPDQIVPTNLCAGDTGKDACSGDSGGPLMAYENGIYSQIGIVSWGVGCGTFNYPGVYTRVTSYLSWIKNNFN